MRPVPGARGEPRGERLLANRTEGSALSLLQHLRGVAEPHLCRLVAEADPQRGAQAAHGAQAGGDPTGVEQVVEGFRAGKAFLAGEHPRSYLVSSSSEATRRATCSLTEQVAPVEGQSPLLTMCAAGW